MKDLPKDNRIFLARFPDSYVDTAFTILTLDNSVYQFIPKCIDLREHPVLLTLTKADSFYFTFYTLLNPAYMKILLST